MKRAVFFDRDGVINHLVDRGVAFERNKGVRYTSPWMLSELKMFEGVGSVIASVRERGYLAIVATNQPGISNREMHADDLREIHAAIKALGFDDIRTCSHNDLDMCTCRKPKPGLLTDAAHDWDIDLSVSFFVGDMESDIATAAAARCSGVLISRPYNTGVKARYVIKELADILQILPN